MSAGPMNAGLPPVAFLDLAACHRPIEDELAAAAAAAVRSGWYVLGPGTAAFEAEFAAYCGAAHCVGVADGLDALHLSLRALDIGPGDEVIVPAHTFIASWLAVSHAGATPVPVEVDPDDACIDPQRIADAVTSRTRAVMPVHLYGHPADMDAVAAVAAACNLPVIEDAAQAHGARYKGRPVGGLSRLTCWSFYPGKNLGALGDGGAVTTDDPALAERLRRLRNYGSAQKYVHQEVGYNSRLDELQARLLSVKLRRLDEWNDRRRAIAARYLAELADAPLRPPTVRSWADPAWHLFPVYTPRRDALQRHLAAAGVQTLIHYPTPPHLQDAYRDMGLKEGSFPVSEQICREELSLPMGPHLDDDAVGRVIAAVRSFRPQTA
jgi:dTDP-4-amino-4,6-dideoxygalactose transaminase